MVCKQIPRCVYACLVILFIVAFPGTKASGQQLNSRISIALDSGRLDKVLLQLQHAANFPIAYESSGLHLISVKAKRYKHQTLGFILKDLLDNSGYFFEEQQNTIIIGPKNEKQQLGNVAGTRIYRGIIEDKETGERLFGVSVYDPDNQSSHTITDKDGYFSLPSISDTLRLQLKYLSYSPAEVILYSSDAPMVRIKMTVEQTKLDSVLIVAPGDVTTISPLSKVSLPVNKIRFLPGLCGDVDLLNIARITPGVLEANDGSGSLVVRGGAPDGNLVLLDGATIYGPTHSFGLFSSVNANYVKEASLYKGSFPARFNGRISSVWDINLLNGDTQHVHGKITIGTMASDFHITGPIIRNKTTFMVSGRKSYYDYYLARSTPGIDFYFQDLNVKLSHFFSPKDNLSLTAYTSKDHFYLPNVLDTNEVQFKSSLLLETKNDAAVVNWNHTFNTALAMKLSCSYTAFSLLMENQSGAFPVDKTLPWLNQKETIKNGLHDMAASLQVKYSVSTRHAIELGGYYIKHVFDKAAFTLNYTSSDSFFFPPVTLKDSIVDKPAHEGGFFIEDRVKLLKAVSITAGIHSNNYVYGSKSYFSVQPRANVRYRFAKAGFIDLGYARMQQNLHRLSISRTSLPVDFWIPSTEMIRPIFSDQVNLGLSFPFCNNIFDLAVETYYKSIGNVSAYLALPDSANSHEPGWASKTTSGKGAAYGIECSLKKSKGNFNGWLSYTLSWSNRTLPEINDGKTFYYQYDRRHSLNLVATYTVKKIIDCSAVFSFQSKPSSPVLIIKSNDNSPQAMQLKDQAASVDLKAYHRLDLGASWHVKYARGLSGNWNLSVLNIYNRKNLFYYFYNNSNQLSGISLLPVSVSVSHTLIF